MARYGWVSLTTDYGLSDGFVAACHGVIAKIAPALRVIDVTHQITPGDVPRAAALLAQAVPHLPPAVHVAVVDPGVGTARRGVAIQAAGGILVGPDNGLLTWAVDALGGGVAVAELTNREWFHQPVSRTFHGRDIFAPAAARLASGAALADAGPALPPERLVRLPDPVVTPGDGWLESEVLTVDRFGNVQLAAAGAALDALAPLAPLAPLGPPGGPGAQAVGGLTVGGLPALRGATFADAPAGGLVVMVDSADRVAVSVNGGRAAVVLGVAPGDVLRITRGG